MDPTPGQTPVAIEVATVSKRFKKHSEPAKTLKERALTWRSSSVETFHALREVDFEVRAGETFGILGHNGSGKSTLLKCIAGTIRPSDGIVRVRGRLSALLELGAGFHPDLTGRENVYLNGSILGFSRARIDEIFDDIVDFAGLSEFIDTQVKHYSSGMYARLGFAVAVNLEPDVLLVDEVLAVGDEAFQKKCFERIRGFQRDGRTICLVTHSPEQVRELCDRALVLDHGRMIHLGDVDEAVLAYRRSLGEEPIELTATEVPAAQPLARLDRVTVEPPAAGRSAFDVGDDVTVTIDYTVHEDHPVMLRLIIRRPDSVTMLNMSSADAGVLLPAVAGTRQARFVIADQPLTDGRYDVTVVLTDGWERVEFDRNEQLNGFDVDTGGPIYGPIRLTVRVEEGAVEKTL